MHGPLDYLPTATVEDAKAYLEDLIPSIMDGTFDGSSMLSTLKSVSPPTQADTARYIELHKAAPDSLEYRRLCEQLIGYQIVPHGVTPLSGVKVREVLADYLQAARTLHNEDPTTVAYLTIFYASNGIHLKAFDKEGAHTKLLRKDTHGRWHETLWNDLDIDEHDLSYLPNPFHCTNNDIHMVRGL